MKYWIADDKAKPIFANIFERSCVWAAFSERSYEGIGVCGGLGGKPRQMFEGTTSASELKYGLHRANIKSGSRKFLICGKRKDGDEF